jgi:hypothetical protein
MSKMKVRCIDWARCNNKKKEGMIVGCSAQGEVLCPFDVKPVPKKPKMVRVKAWVYPSAMEHLTDKSASGIIIKRASFGDADYIPCTILIEAKHLKGKP